MKSMVWLNKWTLTSKITCLAALLVFSIIIILFYSATGLKQIQSELDELVNVDIPLMEVAAELEIAELEQHIIVEQLKQNDFQPDIELLKKFESYSIYYEQQILNAKEIFAKDHLLSSDKELKELEGSLIALHAEHTQLSTELRKIIESKDHSSSAFQKQAEEFSLRFSELDKKSADFLHEVEDLTNRVAKLTEKHNKTFAFVSFILSMSAIILGSILSIFLVISIRKKFKYLSTGIKEATDAINEDKVLPKIEISSDDEFSELATDLSQMFNIVQGDRKAKEKLMQQLKVLASTDQLTGIYNRSKWEELLSSEIGRALRGKTKLSMIVFDIDYFKEINDNNGHDVGDEVLKEFSAFVNKSIRDVDYLFRIGGEEFSILAPFTNHDQAFTLADKIRKSISKHTFCHGAQLMVSMGVAEYIPSEDKTDFYKRADRALYQAKQDGRNRVRGSIT